MSLYWIKLGCINKSKMFFSIEYEIYMADGYGSQDPDGNWDGLVGELVNR